jgi:glycosyltransferase involved in cell wall biosynthesis
VRVALVTVGAIPNPDANGATLANWALATYLVRRGHDVAVCAVHESSYADPSGATAKDRVARLRDTGVHVTPILARAADHAGRSGLQRAWKPRDEELFPSLGDAPAVREAVEAFEPDAVFAYSWSGVAASRALRGRVPRLGVVVDLAHLPALYRFRLGSKRPSRQLVAEALGVQALARSAPRLMVRLLQECDAAGDFAAHHALWLRRKGVAHCEYLRTPVEDAAGAGWRAARDRHAGSTPPRILLIGHLHGTSTLDGLALFAEEVLPVLEELLGPEGFEVRIGGGWEPPPDLRAALSRPSVRYLGHLSRPDEEFAAADLVLVPTSVPLGARVRIISAWSYGCPVVAHAANQLGVPELVHDDNALLGQSGRELANGAVSVLRRSGLERRLEDAGRATYERYFAPEVAAARIEEILATLSLRRATERPAEGSPIPARP